MNITTSNNERMSARPGDVDAMSNAASYWDWGSEYAFHRHCQKTVCSAYGYEGAGATWSILSPNIQSEWDSDLQNLQSMMQTGQYWQQFFTRNENNITQDLRSILELIDRVSGSIRAPFYVSFRDNKNNLIGTRQLINPWDGSTEYVFGGFGKDVKLQIDDGDTVTFNTMSGSGDTINITAPKRKLSFSMIAGAEFGHAFVNMDEDKNISIPYNSVNFKMLGKTFNTIKVATAQNWDITVPKDYNRIPTSYGTSDPQGGAGTITQSGATYIVKPHPGVHIYRISASSNFNLMFNLANYQSRWDVFGRDFGQQILEFEVHIRNASASTITFANIFGTTYDNWFTSWISEDAAKPTNWTYLNDKNTIEAYNTAAYVFRIDTYQKSMTWSLAYICPTSG